MIQLQRDRTPGKITPELKGDKLKEKIRKVLVKRIEFETGVKDKFKVDSHWSSAKDQLFEESHNKCAYCETEIAAGTFGQVEHYRPKSQYWWLAYTIDNYVVSCDICNNRKRDGFETQKVPVSPGPLPALNDATGIDAFTNRFALDPEDVNFDQTPCGLAFLKAAESPRLIHPYLEDPEIYFKWESDDALREVEVLPIRNDHPEIDKINYTIDLLDLNRLILKRKRFDYLEKLRLQLKVKIEAANHPELSALTEQIIQLYLEPRSEYTAMKKYYIKTA